jgi:hypothetical protein
MSYRFHRSSSKQLTAITLIAFSSLIITAYANFKTLMAATVSDLADGTFKKNNGPGAC